MQFGTLTKSNNKDSSHNVSWLKNIESTGFSLILVYKFNFKPTADLNHSFKRKGYIKGVKSKYSNKTASDKKRSE